GEIREMIKRLMAESAQRIPEHLVAFGVNLSPQASRTTMDVDASTLPSPALSDNKLRTSYAAWLGEQQTRLLKARLPDWITLPDVSIQQLTRRPVNERDRLIDGLVDLLFPAAFQPFRLRYPLVALCCTYEQTWKPLGYTRGELISSLGLAPGERLTLEV